MHTCQAREAVSAGPGGAGLGVMCRGGVGAAPLPRLISVFVTLDRPLLATQLFPSFLNFAIKHNHFLSLPCLGVLSLWSKVYFAGKSQFPYYFFSPLHKRERAAAEAIGPATTGGLLMVLSLPWTLFSHVLYWVLETIQSSGLHGSPSPVSHPCPDRSHSFCRWLGGRQLLNSAERVFIATNSGLHE